MVNEADFDVETVSTDAAPETHVVEDAPAAVETAAEATEPAAADPAEGEGESERDAQGRFAKKNPRNNPQARISQAVAKQRDAERRAEELAAELERLRAAHRPAAPVAEPAKPEPVGKPKREDFLAQIGTTYPTYEAAQDAYDDARDAWRDSRQPPVETVIEQRLAVREAQREAARVLTAHQQRMAAAESQYPDYKETVAQAEQLLTDLKITLPPALQFAMFDSPKSADVVYWLATHPTDLLQLARQSAALPVSAAALLRRDLESRVGAGAGPGAAPPAVVSTAKPPIKPVGASHIAPQDEGSESESFDAYFARENARERKQRLGRGV